MQVTDLEQSSLAVLIDADNAQASVIEELLAEVSKYGIASVKRIYGDWTNPSLGSWKKVLLVRPQPGQATTEGLNERSPWFAFMMLLIMFSMAGVPPTVGFYAKLLVLQAVIKVDMVWLAAVAVVFAIIGAYYYIRVIKLMYFDEPLEALDRPLGPVLRLMIASSSMAMILFLLVAGPVVSGAGAAAAALFAG